jgi:hypothetical protein
MSGRLVPSARAGRISFSSSSAFLFSAVTLLTLVACSSPVEGVPSTLGGIEVTVMSVGEGALPDSLVVLLNGSISGVVEANDVYTIPYLPADGYLISLRDEWEGCWVRNNNRPVQVERHKVAGTTFIVQCR